MEVLNMEGVQDGRKVVGIELDVNDGTNDGLDRAGDALRLGRVGARFSRRNMSFQIFLT